MLMRKKSVCKMLDVSPATVWRMVQDGRLPAPRKLGENSVAWIKSEIEDFVSSLPIVTAANMQVVAPGARRGRKPSASKGA
ncbi:MAG TPA: AlpA family phage regulatory protein [Desulfuromonadales bacterium]|nr:AlpA family phage regulatory protein [Desulfuromonadales bacterium]